MKRRWINEANITCLSCEMKIIYKHKYGLWFPRFPKISQDSPSKQKCIWLPVCAMHMASWIYKFVPTWHIPSTKRLQVNNTTHFFVMEIDLSHPVTKIVISISLLSAHAWPRHRLLLDCRQGCGFGQACGTEDKLCLELLESHRGITGEILSHTLFETKEKSVTISLSLFGNHFFHGLV